jgi:hypothetical protein
MLNKFIHIELQYAGKQTWLRHSEHVISNKTLKAAWQYWMLV